MIVLLAVVVLAASHAASASAHRNYHALWRWYHQSGAACVHHYEGAWDANTGNGYYGGFQMDRSFQAHWNPRRYYSHGTADHWTHAHQVATVRRAVRAIGWGPWPNTARMCGLL